MTTTLWLAFGFLAVGATLIMVDLPLAGILAWFVSFLFSLDDMKLL